MKKVKIIQFFILLLLMLLMSACTIAPVEPSEPPDIPSIEDPSMLDPEFVSDESFFADPDKQYVLPDGYLYLAKKTLVYAATNRLETASDSDGSLYNGKGYLDKARIRSVLVIDESEDSFVTGFIAVKAGDTLYFSGNVFDPTHKHANLFNAVFYGANREVLGRVTMQTAISDGYFELLETNEAGYAKAIKIKSEGFEGELAYIRLTLIGSGNEQVIGVNESLDEYREEAIWYKTDPYIPEYWFDEIKATVDTVNSLELADPSKTVKFMLSSDIHLAPGSTFSYTRNLGVVASSVMRALDLPYLLDAGDSSTQSNSYMPDDFAQNIEDVLAQLDPIPRQQLLMALGNHDGATGSAIDSASGEKITYCYQLTNEERSKVFFDWQRESNPYKCFDTDGTYYYLDDPSTKTRYIVLNSFWSQWEGDEDGCVLDLEHSFFHSPRFGQKQLMWFADHALDMPEGYGAVIVVHEPSAAADFEIFKGIVDAYNKREAYTGEYIGQQDWQSVTVWTDYKDAQGEIIVLFQGHNHLAAEHDYFETIPCINLTTTGAYWDVRDENEGNREVATSSEFAVEVVVIDREARKIYLTRLGIGEDRVISY